LPSSCAAPIFDALKHFNNDDHDGEEPMPTTASEELFEDEGTKTTTRTKLPRNSHG